MKKLLVGAAALWSAAGLAATTTTSDVSGVSATTAQAVSPSPKQLPLSLVANNDLYGPAVTDISSRETADGAREAKMGLNSRSQIGLGYKINDTTSIAPTLDFNLVYTHPKEIGTSERNFNWNDSYIKLSRSGIAEANLKGNAIALDGDLRYLLPTSKSARDADSRGSVRLTLSPSVQIGKSKFSFSAVNYVRYYFYRDAAEFPSAASWRIYTGPQLNYEVSDKITAFMLLEAIDIFDNQGYSKTKNSAASLVDLEPGVNFKVSNAISLTPYLNWYTNQPADTTSVNLNATIKML